MRFARRSVVRSQRAARDAVPDLIELVIIGIRAGLSPSVALRAATSHVPDELAAPVGEVLVQLRRGKRLADALAALPDWLGRDIDEVTDALVTADRYGLPLEPMLDRLSADVRATRRRRAQEAARTLPVKLSFPLVVCTLPSFALLAVAPAVMGAVSTITERAP